MNVERVDKGKFLITHDIFRICYLIFPIEVTNKLSDDQLKAIANDASGIIARRLNLEDNKELGYEKV